MYIYIYIYIYIVSHFKPKKKRSFFLLTNSQRQRLASKPSQPFPVWASRQNAPVFYPYWFYPYRFCGACGGGLTPPHGGPSAHWVVGGWGLVRGQHRSSAPFHCGFAPPLRVLLVLSFPWPQPVWFHSFFFVEPPGASVCSSLTAAPVYLNINLT